MKSSLRLFCVGFLMGMADLIPGISGGSIAFICGVYEELLVAIKSLQLNSFKSIRWSFLLPMGGGLILAVLLFSRLVYFLLVHYRPHLFGLLFGLIGASTLICLRRAKIEHPTHYALLVIAALLSLLLAFLPTGNLLAGSIFGLIVAGALAALAMLLPGISGSYLLHMLGVYPLMIAALAAPKGGYSLLAFLGFGIAFGFVIFSRLVHLLLTHFRSVTLAILIGLMVGGMGSLWPFHRGAWTIPFVFMMLGFLSTLLIEIIVRKRTKLSSPKIDSVIK